MIYTQAQKDSIIYQSQVWLGDLGEQLVALEEGMQPCSDLYCNGYRVRVYMQALQRNDEFVASTPVEEPPVQIGLKDWQEENIYTCLVSITGIHDYPVFTPLTIVGPPPVIVGEPGPAGPPGQDGQDGTSANIDVRSNIPSILIQETQEGEVKVYTLVDNTYIEPTVVLALDPSLSVTEIGNVIDVTMNINLFKGRDDVLSSTIISPSGIDASYQSIVDLAALNAGGPSARNVIAAGIIATTTFNVDIADGIPNTNNASKVKTFVYPFFDGSTVADTVNPYSGLNKNIATKSNKSVAYDADGEYFWFCYPASYGDLSSIKDQNGFEVLASFTKTVEDVTSTGLANNWTESYNYYRTTDATNIHGTFTFNF